MIELIEGELYPEPDFFLLHNGIGTPSMVKLMRLMPNRLIFEIDPHNWHAIEGNFYEEYMIQLESWYKK